MPRRRSPITDTADQPPSKPLASVKRTPGVFNIALVGVVAGRSRGGAALISVDGKPARPFRVGSAIDEGLWLSSVEGRRAVIAATAAGPALLTLELPALRR